MWTGDSNSTWESLSLSLPMFESLGLSGEPFVGGDIGGFMGRGDGELLTRWYEVAFLTPFCRNHKDHKGYDQEPWRFGKYYEDIIRKFLKLRYQLMPFLYTTLEEAHRTGIPIVRPLVLNYQNDENTVNLDDEFMIGDDLLVAPILKPNLTQRPVYLPSGIWYDFWTNQRYFGGRMISVNSPLETVPMFVRGGAIIPMWPTMNYIGERKPDPITFAIYPDAAGRASMTLYEDDGVSPAYKTDTVRRTMLNVSRTAQGFRIDVSCPTGNYSPGPRTFRFVVKRPFREPAATVGDNGKAQRLFIR
jgi:alpha-glucosidase